MRVLHCLTTVGGNPQGLCRAERALGLDSRSIALGTNYLAYAVDDVIGVRGGRLGRELARWRAINRSLRAYDVIHYNFGSTLAPIRARTDLPGIKGRLARWYNFLYAGPLEQIDLRWARRRGLITAMTYQGDDARQGDFCRENYVIHFVHDVERGYYTAETDRHKRGRIKRADAWVDLLYAVNPDLLRVLPARTRFLPYASVDPREWVPAPGRQDTPPLRPYVIHAPSHRGVKGSGYVIAAVERLQREGVSFDFTLVENLSNKEARRLYATADLAVDQLLAGFYGGFAVELMALEVPVVAYLRPEDIALLPSDLARDLPLIQAVPDTIYSVLKDWLTVRKGDLRSKGRESRRFVERWHDPLKIARGVIADYERIRTDRISTRESAGRHVV